MAAAKPATIAIRSSGRCAAANRWGSWRPPSAETIRAGEATGTLFGGTLTQLLASLGTPFAFDPPAGHVLFLDEVGERPYRLDRMITQLRQAGLLARASGVIFGELPRCDEPSGDPTARAVVAELFADFPGPVVFGFPSGHTTGAAHDAAVRRRVPRHRRPDRARHRGSAYVSRGPRARRPCASRRTSCR